MASIQPIEGGSVHRIQSGQVIVDLCSVVKELVENSLDAGATSIDVRFRNHGLDSIEVQDNGSGVSKENYESIALKHHTSKLRTYADLTQLSTFGFRGEALSSLCALADVHLLTATAATAPRGDRLTFAASGALQATQTAAAQRGTTVVVGSIFRNLPVRRQELAKNARREFAKAVALLQAYACVSTGVKVGVSNTMGAAGGGGGGKKSVLFATRQNASTRENVANVFGAKTVAALVPLDLEFEMRPTNGVGEGQESAVKVLGHVSRPVVGEGRQTPDRQMFFVNSRPCALPQVAKVMNEVYKSYNLSQSPFIFANVVLDTNAYDVNVSPDKRTILLHDQGQLLESIKETLIELFDNQQQTVPQSTYGANKQQSIQKSLTISREQSTASEHHAEEPTQSEGPEEPTRLRSSGSGLPAYKPVVTSSRSLTSAGPQTLGNSDNEDSADGPEAPEEEGGDDDDAEAAFQGGLISQLFHSKVQHRPAGGSAAVRKEPTEGLSVGKQKLVGKIARQRESEERNRDEVDDSDNDGETEADLFVEQGRDRHVADFNQRVHGRRQAPVTRSPPSASLSPEPDIPSISSTPARSSPGVVPNAFERMRPMRMPKQTATITVGDKTTTSTIGTSALRYTRTPQSAKIRQKIWPSSNPKQTGFQSSLRAFAAPGTQMSAASEEDDYDDDEEPVVRSTRASTFGRTSSEPVLRESPSNTLDAAPPSPETVDSAPDEDGEKQSDIPSEEDSDGEYIDEKTKKIREDEKVARLIAEAEEKAARPSDDSMRRAQNLLKGGHKDATTKLLQTLDVSLDSIRAQSAQLQDALHKLGDLNASSGDSQQQQQPENPEQRLSLTVSKADFARMRIVGQFNLGFILAVRPSSSSPDSQGSNNSKDELFIIDQHASDEKYNFERLQATTVVQTQRLVQPQPLELTAMEEELVASNAAALQLNGFGVVLASDDHDDDDADDDGTTTPTTTHRPRPRARLTSLPVSRETTFSHRDLEELLVMLGDTTLTTTTGHKHVPRPSRVRSMFAMRACRSSVMIGKTLSRRQMQRLVANMGGVDKPWNCPHGRPTMRHLFGLAGWEAWEEGDGVVGLENGEGGREVDWEGWLERGEGLKGMEDDEGDGDVQMQEEVAA